ncbi:MAG: VWA domain-containing protein [Vicinamibacteria bacterium]
MRRSAAVTFSFALAASAPIGATPTAAPQDAPEFRSGTAVVLLDVVARDKKGRPVRDLKPEDVQVYENDKRCEVRSFRLVESEGTIEPGMASAAAEASSPAPGASPAANAAAAPPLNLVTIVFDRMSLEDARSAEKAARSLVDRAAASRVRVSIFGIATGLSLLQDFTTDADALRRAVAAGTAGRDLKDRPLTSAAQQAARNEALQSGLPVGGAQPETGDTSLPSTERITGAQARTPGVPEDFRGPKFLEWITRALRMADSLQRQAEGEWSVYPLLALVKAQGLLPGRKTLVFLSPGLRVPPNLQDVFKTAISEANRSNVSVYTVDVRGLQGRSDIGASGNASREAATTSMMQQMKSASDPTTVQEMQMFDTALDSLTLNAQQTLSDLAEGTGGFLAANANDFGNAADRIAADIRGYYEIRYTPAVVSFDGGFRRIELKVARKDVVVQSRAGYFALPPSEEIVLPFEAPLFLALSAASPARDFPHQAAALHFAPGPEGTETAVVVEVPLAPLDFEVDRKKKTFGLRLSTLAVVRAVDGRVVERFSDEYPIAGVLDHLESVKQSNAVLRRSVPLAPGRYTLETVSQVRGGGKTSVAKTPFEVPAAGDGPQVSSLCLLRRADPLPPDTPASGDPFRYEASRLVPHLSGPVSQGATPNLSFFARLYPAGSEPGRLTLDFLRDGKIVGRAQPPLPAPDAAGASRTSAGCRRRASRRGGLRGAPHARAGRPQRHVVDPVRDRPLARLGAPERRSRVLALPRVPQRRRHDPRLEPPTGERARERAPGERVPLAPGLGVAQPVAPGARERQHAALDAAGEHTNGDVVGRQDRDDRLGADHVVDDAWAGEDAEEPGARAGWRLDAGHEVLVPQRPLAGEGDAGDRVGVERMVVRQRGVEVDAGVGVESPPAAPGREHRLALLQGAAAHRPRLGRARHLAPLRPRLPVVELEDAELEPQRAQLERLAVDGALVDDRAVRDRAPGRGDRRAAERVVDRLALRPPHQVHGIGPRRARDLDADDELGVADLRLRRRDDARAREDRVAAVLQLRVPRLVLVGALRRRGKRGEQQDESEGGAAHGP